MASRPIKGEVYLQRADYVKDIFDQGQRAIEETYWLADPKPNGMVEVTLLDADDEPSGYKETIAEAEFRKRFDHQPGYFKNRPSAKERLLNRILDIADGHYQAEEYNSAEYEYKRALKLDEDSVRANFGLGLTHMAKKEYDQAKAVFLKLAHLDVFYEPHHKHLFNELGIRLRKLGLYREALDHYYQALTIARDDEHLWFNLGRLMHEDKNNEAAEAMIAKALALNPEFKAAKVYRDQYLRASQQPAGDIYLEA